MLNDMFHSSAARSRRAYSPDDDGCGKADGAPDVWAGAGASLGVSAPAAAATAAAGCPGAASASVPAQSTARARAREAARGMADRVPGMLALARGWYVAGVWLALGSVCVG